MADISSITLPNGQTYSFKDTVARQSGPGSIGNLEDLTTENKTDIVSAINEVNTTGYFTDTAKQALLNCFQHVAWADETGATYYGHLHDTIFGISNIASISAVFNTGGITIWSDDSLDSLRQYLTVTATHVGGTTETVSLYELTGSLDSSPATITVSYFGRSTTFTTNVTVVGKISYVSDFSNWVTSYATPLSGNVMYGQCSTQTAANNYSSHAEDNKALLWSNAVGKTFRIRFTGYCDNWVGAMSTSNPQNRVQDIIAIFSSNTSNTRLRYTNLANHVMTREPMTTEYIFEAKLSNFTGGSGTITSDSRFGANIYYTTVNGVVTTSVDIREILS